MFSSMSNSLCNIILASLCVQAVVAAPTTPVEMDLVKRAGPWYLAPCYPGSVLGTGSPMSTAKNFNFRSAPWFPNCANIKGPGEGRCLACMAVAGAVYYAALEGCTAGSLACTVGAWACESVCVATATYVLWAAEQACYCEHANCSDAAQRNGGKIGAPPDLQIGGTKFHLKLPPGWGYVGNRSVKILRIGPSYPPNRC
ncbi:hypothetical protein M3J09_011090 [Ascochyta lentis]